MSPLKMSYLESNTRVVLDLHTAYNQHDIPSILTFLSPDCILETASPAPDGTTLKGLNIISSHLQDLFAQNPDLKLDIEDIFGQAFHVVMRWQQAGRETPSRGVDLFKFHGDQIIQWLRYGKCY